MAGAAPNTADIVDDVALRRAVVGDMGDGVRRSEDGRREHEGVGAVPPATMVPPASRGFSVSRRKPSPWRPNTLEYKVVSHPQPHVLDH